ncbi:MAG: hypothetical protein ABII74_05135 [Elusimicrobiota bacterium]
MATKNYDHCIGEKMEKKRSKSVTIAGVAILLFSFLILFYSTFSFFIPNFTFPPPRYALFLISGLLTLIPYDGYMIFGGVSFLVGLIYLTSGLYIFKLRNWARILILYCSIFAVISLSIFVLLKILPLMAIAPARLVLILNFVLPIFIPNVLFSITAIYFFTRTKIKDQFKEENMEEEKPVGVTIIGFLFIIFPVINVFVKGISHSPLQLFFIGLAVSYSVISGIGILLLKEWARKLVLIFSILAIIDGLLTFFINPQINLKNNLNLGMNIWNIIYFGLVLYYFTRSKTKEQFKYKSNSCPTMTWNT